ncbi:MAG: hypothetical protein K2N91_06730, partial [Muribaculaceae bacterium]|nr:hypothetical protein [Muribaculaceae bacterium]
MRYRRDIVEAERIMSFNADSALTILDNIDPSELKSDSIRAKYHFLKAWGHMRTNRSMISDSMITFASDYYRGKDKVYDIRSATALAWYKFWAGDMHEAFAILDSLSSLPDVPDSLLSQSLRVHCLLGASEYQGRQL